MSTVPVSIVLTHVAAACISVSVGLPGRHHHRSIVAPIHIAAGVSLASLSSGPMKHGGCRLAVRVVRVAFGHQGRHAREVQLARRLALQILLNQGKNRVLGDVFVVLFQILVVTAANGEHMQHF